MIVKAKQIIAILLTATFITMPVIEVSAHNLYSWSQYYTQQRAFSGQDNQFSMGYRYHNNGRVLKYYWNNNTAKNRLQSNVNTAAARWGGMISVQETSRAEAVAEFLYDPDGAVGNIAAYVMSNSGDANTHFRPGVRDSWMVVYNIPHHTNESNNRLVMHELGHFWGVGDLYTYSNAYRESIYAKNSYDFATPTRHDKNALYIGLNEPWYLHSDNRWYYQKSCEVWANSEWRDISGSKFYFDGGSRMLVNAWQKDETGRWCYVNSEGRALGSQWSHIGGSWYYFDAGCRMLNGWHHISGQWYYFDQQSGKMQTGWVKIGAEWFYLNSSGAMQTGWVKIGAEWFYLNHAGVMQTGWLKDGSKWFYLNAAGVMHKGWVQIGSTWYYLRTANDVPVKGSEGEMIMNATCIINGVRYSFNSSGAMM